MKKDYILNEIRRTSINGIPLGYKKFAKETGINKSDWYIKHWTKYSDAIREAGFEPNKFGTEGFDEEWLIKQLIDFIKDIGWYPTQPDFLLKKRSDNDFPSIATFFNRLGKQHEQAEKVVEYCEKNNVFPGVLEICRPLCKSEEINITNEIDDSEDEEFGVVYLMLMKARKDYKLGHSGHAGRRNYELGIKMPEKLELIHEIRTDDPVGIEDYWKKRFKDKQQRERTEWYKLTSKDVKAFKRRKFM